MVSKSICIINHYTKLALQSSFQYNLAGIYYVNYGLTSNKFNLTNHVIPAAKYNEMQQYMDNIAKAQNKKLIIRRKA